MLHIVHLLERRTGRRMPASLALLAASALALALAAGIAVALP